MTQKVLVIQCNPPSIFDFQGFTDEVLPQEYDYNVNQCFSMETMQNNADGSGESLNFNLSRLYNLDERVQESQSINSHERIESFILTLSLCPRPNFSTYFEPLLFKSQEKQQKYLTSNLFMLKYIPSFNFSFTYPCPRKLREIVKISLFERESKDQVIALWMEYHKDKESNVAYVVSKQEHSILARNMKESPLFLLPIKRKGGHFQMIGQAQTNSILFTYLEEYKKSGSFSSPHFILTMFDELLASKQVALIRGDIMDYKIDKDEAFFLTNQFLKFYLTPEYYQKFIYTLNHNQEEFNYEDFRNHFQI